MSCFIPAITGRYLFTCKENRVGQLYDILNSEKGFPDSSAGKESASNAGDPGLIPGSGRSTGKGIGYPLQYSWASLVAQLVKNPLAMQETWVQFLGWEDPLEKGKATHSSILAWRIPWTVQSIGSQRVWHDWVTLTLHKPLIFLHHSYSSADIWATTAALSV